MRARKTASLSESATHVIDPTCGSRNAALALDTLEPGCRIVKRHIPEEGRRPPLCGAVVVGRTAFF